MNEPQRLSAQMDQISIRRLQEANRLKKARELHPKLQTDRVRGAHAIFWAFREACADEFGLDPHDALDAHVLQVKHEVLELEVRTGQLALESQKAGPSIRRALGFLRRFGRLAVHDHSTLPQSTRTAVIEWLKWEYRWCFAAAGTTPKVFKREIGRTGAR